MPAQCLESRNHLVTISMSSIVLIAALTFSLAQAHGSEWGDLPAIKGLDFSNVEIYPLIAVHTRNPRQDTSQLSPTRLLGLQSTSWSGFHQIERIPNH